MYTLKIHDWDEWQSYRKDRGQPPWIKIHRSILRTPKWAALSDAEKGQLVLIWLLAADKEGMIPDDPALVQRLCLMEKKPNLNRFIELGFIDDTMTPDRRQVDAKLTTQSRVETEAETEENRIDMENENNGKAYISPFSVMKLFNESFPDAAKAELLNDSRKRAIKKLMKEAEMYDEDTWGAYFHSIKQSNFLMGRTQSNGREPFRLHFDFILKTNNFIKIMEGGYS